MNHRYGKQRSVRLTKKILFTAVLGALTYAIAERAIGGGPLAILATLIIGGVSLVAQFLIDVEHRLGSVESHQQEHNAAAEKMIQLNFARISEITETFSKVDGSAIPAERASELLQKIASVPKDSPPLISQLAQSELLRIARFFQELGHGGSVTYDGEDRDWLLSLAGNASSSLKATSLTIADSDGQASTDSSLWTSDLGQRYFDLQHNIIENGIDIHRIFLVTNPAFLEDKGFLELCQAHKELGAHVQVLDLNVLPIPIRSSVDDFIIFDESLVYEMSTVSRMGPTEFPLLTTKLILDQESVTKKIKLFDTLQRAGTDFCAKDA